VASKRYARTSSPSRLNDICITSNVTAPFTQIERGTPRNPFALVVHNGTRIETMVVCRACRAASSMPFKAPADYEQILFSRPCRAAGGGGSANPLSAAQAGERAGGH
jgi:hypothetical protein